MGRLIALAARFVLAASVVLALTAPPASAAISAPTELGSEIAIVGSTLISVNVSAAVPAGDTVIVVVGQGSSGVASISDGVCTYSSGGAIGSAPSANRLRVFYCPNHPGLASGSTISFSSTVGTRLQMKVLSVSGLAISPFDQQSGGGSAADTVAPSVITAPATGSLAQAEELILGLALVNNGSTDTYDHGSGWTPLTKAASGVAGEVALQLAYRVTSATSPVTYGPATNSVARTWLAASVAFKAAGPAPSGSSQSLLLLGVGQ